MKTPPSVTRACTWACPAVRRTSTAAPTCRPTCRSREAPKRPSASPPSSAPPNSHRTVTSSYMLHATCYMLHATCYTPLPTFSLHSIHLDWTLCDFCFQSTCWLFWTGRPIRTGCWTSWADCVRSAARRLSRSLSSDRLSNDVQDVKNIYCLCGFLDHTLRFRLLDLDSLVKNWWIIDDIIVIMIILSINWSDEVFTGLNLHADFFNCS